MTIRSLTDTNALPAAIYVWIVPSEEVLDQPGSWRIRKWDTEPFPEANFTLRGAGDDGGITQALVQMARENAIEECRAACLSVGKGAHEAAKAKDATDYIAGYQDAAVDCDEAIMALSSATDEQGKC